jgi:hypothetical protein
VIQPIVDRQILNTYIGKENMVLLDITTFVTTFVIFPAGDKFLDEFDRKQSNLLIIALIANNITISKLITSNIRRNNTTINNLLINELRRNNTTINNLLINELRTTNTKFNNVLINHLTTINNLVIKQANNKQANDKHSNNK